MMARKICRKHGIYGDDVEVFGVSPQDGDKVWIGYTFNWGGVYERDSFIVPAEEFWKEGKDKNDKLGK